ncbi:iron complex transport system permease protein [Methanohalophilus levihalophilus]|uniref:FecCD family ABC transporter permease n=1 Tax=Methanohalophilus levihalophilus TaxID=1431282 RepID=UPI001AE40251|nr:iron ABC transporter permease [Methanohalophilus levihalophilus]MBP2030541.1 iron complex transport system permease protein [Methanohalophilus levihalophilus]
MEYCNTSCNHEENTLHSDYHRYIGKKIAFIGISISILIALFFYSLSVGNADLTITEIINSILGFETENIHTPQVIWELRIPRAIAAIVAGIALSVSGVVLQSILRNPLGSPYTLGISHAAAFGATLAILASGRGWMGWLFELPYTVTIFAFIFSLISTLTILAIAKYRNATPEVLILTGVALSSLLTAATMLLQYFADDTELPEIVFWTFGDLGRAYWECIFIMAIITILSTAYFVYNRWNYMAIDAGDETAKGLGVNVERIRLFGMLVASLATAAAVSFLGIIGFIGLVCPHIARRFVGDDQRYLIPAACVVGALLLLASDIVSRMVIAPYVLPVGIITAFMGAPLFLYLLVRGYRN